MFTFSVYGAIAIMLLNMSSYLSYIYIYIYIIYIYIIYIYIIYKGIHKTCTIIHASPYLNISVILH